MSARSVSSGARAVRTPAGASMGSRNDVDEMQRDAFVFEDLGDRAEQHVRVARAEVEQELGEAPVGADGGEDLLVLDLAGHHGAGDAFVLEGFDEF